MNSASVAAIKEALNDIEHERCLIFGSQARGTASAGSDYDIIVVTRRALSHTDRFRISATMRKRLAKQHIDADSLVRSQGKIDDFSELRGSVVRNAMREAVTI
ncbi:MAG: hypothetical protein GF410_18335 [Chitinivibrionales bacterium]|nr:hypothetical protein [Chitinivibrionales bacterium]